MSRVYIVDDDNAVRNALKLLFRTAQLDVEAFSSADAFLEDADLTQRCCVLLDIRMPGMTGTALHEELLRRSLRVPVIFITGHGDIPMAVDAMKKGAFDFIEKPFDDERLLSQVRAALETFDAGAPEKPEPGVPLEHLSSRQREVLQRVLDGKPSRQIAEELAISVKTVEFHRSRIMQKLGVKSAAELFRRCLGAG
ncbi:MAG TPA: response regulator [Burkholderiales bacterium]|jgi:FixJ family two-component response regulator|nr:response regulator [Burkholderiales bacterium]